MTEGTLPDKLGMTEGAPRRLQKIPRLSVHESRFTLPMLRLLLRRE